MGAKRRADTWEHIKNDVETLLSCHVYNTQETLKSIGCGEKTLRRYMDRHLIEPLKHSDEWFFTQETVDKANFIHKCKIDFNIPVIVGAAIFDFLLECKCKPTITKLKEQLNKYE